MHFVGTEDELVIGRRMAHHIERRFKLDTDLMVKSRVRAIGHAIAKVSDRKDIPYTFKVIKHKDVNAFTTPGGQVYIFRGLIDKTKSDAELASVIAHEVGHVAARHAAKKMELDMGYNLLMGLAFSKSRKPDIERYIGMGFNVISLGYTREDEKFADKLGVKYLMRAGYDPYGMVRFMETMLKMEKEKGGSSPHILRSHPHMSERIGAAKKEIAYQMMLKERERVFGGSNERSQKSKVKSDAKRHCEERTK